MNIYIILIAVICVIIVVACIITKINHHRYIKNSCEYALETYMRGIDTKDTSVMYHAIMHMYTVCPDCIELCKIKSECPKCEGPHGFRRALLKKYGKPLMPHEVSDYWKINKR